MTISLPPREFFRPPADLVVAKFEPKLGPWLPIVAMPLAAVVAEMCRGVVA